MLRPGCRAGPGQPPLPVVGAGGPLAGLFALNFTFTVFIVALPTVAREFHTRITVLTWTLDRPAPRLRAGRAAVRQGRRPLRPPAPLPRRAARGDGLRRVHGDRADGVGILILARTLDGVQGAATGTASMALIMSSFPPEERVKAMGWWSLVGAGGPVLGVSLGSPIIQYFGWRALFWLQLVPAGRGLLVVALVLPRPTATRRPEDRAMPSARCAAMDWVGTW